MSYRGELPGFYWDEEKRKYFAIQANHYAGAPPGAKYNQERINKEKSDLRKRKREEKRIAARKKTLIRRDIALRFPSLNRVDIVSQLGVERAHDVAIKRGRSAAYIGAVQPKAAFSSLYSHVIDHFVHDHATDGIALTYNSALGGGNRYGMSYIFPVSQHVLGQNIDNDGASLYPSHDIPRYRQSKMKSVSISPSAYSSLEYSPKTRTIVTTTTGDRDPPMVQIHTVFENDIDSTHNRMSTFELDNFVRYSPKDVTTIFSSAVNPWVTSTKQKTFAIGTSAETGITVFTATHDAVHAYTDWQPDGGMKTHSDVLTVDWLSPHLLAGGLRNGAVALYDIRAREGVKRMRHSAGILKLKRADMENRFVVAGMQGKMALYDLRALRESDATSTADMGARSDRSKDGMNNFDKSFAKNSRSRRPVPLQMPAAYPVLTFKYENEIDMLGMDVDVELGMVAAAEHGGYLRVSSLLTGKTVKRWKLGSADEKVQCVRFVEDARGVGKIMVSCGCKILELGL